MEAEEETEGQDGGTTCSSLVEGGGISCGGDGGDLDCWSADSGGEGSAPSGLHLHHHGGLPGGLDLPVLCGF